MFRRAPPITLVIPARFASSRFPGKPLTMLRGAGREPKPLIQWVWEAARRVADVDRVLVATDDRWIAETVTALGCEVVMTSPSCRNGSERCAEAIERAGVRDGIVVNWQGDAPLTPPEAIAALIRTLAANRGVPVASPMLRCSPATVARLIEGDRHGASGGVTVVVDQRENSAGTQIDVVKVDNCSIAVDQRRAHAVTADPQYMHPTRIGAELLL